MCGIAGVVGIGDDAVLHRMCAAMKHRGPDDEGFYRDPAAAAGLGMVRLSIIDVAGGHQPMCDERQRYWVVFNGEIYNHQVLRERLQARGHRFTSGADTEVIVHLYEDAQERCVEHLEGDFAFAIWDTATRQLVLSRDRLGVKPLYYWHQGRQFAFASELKALLCLPQVSRDLDLEALDAYLAFLYVPAPRSIFRAIRKLPPGCSLILKDGSVRITRYWDLESKTRTPLVRRSEWKDAIVERLREAVRARLMSDVPLGVFLSGGIDSSCVTAFMSQAAGRPVKTFSIGFEPPYDAYNELPFARLAAQTFQTDHQEFIVRPDIAALLPQVVWHMDEPFADSSSLLTFLIAREAKRAVTVALTGIGGDELFGGYPRYLGAWASRYYERLPRWMRAGAATMSRALSESARGRYVGGWLKRFIDEGAVPRDRRYLQWISYFHGSLKQGLYTADIQAALEDVDPYAGHDAILQGAPGDYLDRINRLDLATYLPDDLLAMGDKMSMAHGLEVRVPFCDHRLVELAASIPLRERMHGFHLKALLKEAVTPVLPPALLHRPKQGFMVPLGEWLRGDLRPLCAELLAEGVVRKRGLFSPRAVEALVKRHLGGTADLTHQLYALLVFELWCQQYLDGVPQNALSTRMTPTPQRPSEPKTAGSMSIILVTQFFFPDRIGGAGRYVYDLARGLGARGHRVVVLTPSVTGTSHEESFEGIRVVRHRLLRHWWEVPGTLLAIRREFRRLHRQERFDLIAVQQSLPAIPLLFDRGARRLRWVYHFHSPWAHEARIKRPPRRGDLMAELRLGLMRYIEHRVLEHAEMVITLSGWMRQLVATGHRLPEDTVQVVGGCVDLERFQPADSTLPVRQALGLPTDRVLLITVRNLMPRMNLDNLIRAMPIILETSPEALLLICGSGPLKEPLQALIGELKLEDYVRLTGTIPEQELPRWYQAADLFIVPSKALEGFGLATMEALACGIPVVGTPVGGTRELLSRLDPALLCGGTDPTAMAEAIQRALQRLGNLQERQALSARCRTFASQFSLGAMAERIERAYRDAARVKVLHVHTLPVVSGSGLNTFYSMCGQRDAGFEVELACAAGGPLLDLVEREGMTVRRLRHMGWPIRPLQDALAVVELIRLMRRRRYTIVHTHNSKAGFVGRLAAKLAGVPVVIHTVHGFAFHDCERWWRRVLYRWLERLAAHWCDRLIMISQSLVEWAVRERIAPRENMVRIYSGIDLAAFRRPVDRAGVREALGVRDQEFVVGEVAKLWQGKGHEVLLRAAASLKDRIPSLRLLFVGEGGLQSPLEQLAQELGIRDRVVFAGFRTDIPALTRACDVAALPTQFEGMGRAVIEAQAAGTPVVASRIGGIPELIADGRTGMLVEPGNVEQLATAIWELYNDPKRRRRLGEQAQQAVDARFDRATMVDQICHVYETLYASRVGAER